MRMEAWWFSGEGGAPTGELGRRSFKVLRPGVRPFPNRSDPLLAPPSNLWTRERFLVPSTLVGLNRGEYGAEPFVRDDVALGDPSRLFKSHEG